MEGMNNTLVQPASFLIFMYGGVVLGLIGCVFTRLRARFPGRAFCGLCDALLALSFFIVCAACFLVGTRGVLRLYGFLGLALGLLLARSSFGALPIPLVGKKKS